MAAPPSTPEKLAVLEERARLKLALWHPRDAHIENGVIAGAQRSLVG
jgi:hypothetical protein